ncbi:enoyl-CoA hydratase/isomerase family protein [Shinella yambaruensis]|uniref:3-hydroxyisobutyryl-CoA hydrolase n=1 Tax=Shinella yambaruensis TaxID=415996 RepID=A0ABQ5ZHZ6_9HYPH|nr:enoyl-CoA hydratase/isomerase family protein [Shinella yambaruensis]MCJ8027344.1 enoyl-CoA hydratase/isomerase family protein [Shinella yambaruensis]MCU7981400.1 enoyl-CoA hydratase/isomerase family protein [Shinella yambaruensis]GLR52439.1 3-hydroxyisobutyryl-CoA hydrolase [Shinella yambaruensis]
MPSTSDPQTLIERTGTLGRIRLNRPKALNSLTLPMVRDIERALDAFEADPGIGAVLITGEGERGLCAGGDIRMIYDGGRAGSQEPVDFWREEYHLNAHLNRLEKPFVAFMDGIVMGGGGGVSVYASHRIVTERTRFAMPETGIGFFPDVGASWFLTRRRDELGTYAGLTGEPLAAADTIAFGLADSYVPSDRLPDLAENLSRLPASATRAAVSATVSASADAPPPAQVARQHASIDRLFAFDTIEEILDALAKDGSDFAERTLSVLQTKSPLSLKVTLRLLRLGRQETSLEACLEREFAATAAVLRSHDFYEGVRAAVVDKDRNPQWRPARLGDVTPADVAAFFAPSEEPLFAGVEGKET